MKKNDAKLAKLQDIAKEEILSGGGFLDHGFTRPKVMLVLSYDRLYLLPPCPLFGVRKSISNL